MKIIIKGEAKEIAALVLAVQERREEDECAEFTKRLHQELKVQLGDIRAGQESQ